MGYGIPVEPDMENSTTLGIAIPRRKKKISLEGDSAPLVWHLCRKAPCLQNSSYASSVSCFLVVASFLHKEFRSSSSSPSSSSSDQNLEIVLLLLLLWSRCVFFPSPRLCIQVLPPSGMVLWHCSERLCYGLCNIVLSGM